MNKLIYKTLFLFGTMLLLAPLLFAQAPNTPLVNVIKQAQEELQKLEAFMQASSTSASLRASLQPILETRRAALKELETLQASIKLTPEEQQQVLANLAKNSISAKPSSGTDSPVVAAKRAPRIDDQSLQDQSQRITGDRGTEGASVEIFVNDQSVGTTAVNERGNFSKALSAPLSIGDRVKIQQTSGEGDNRVVSYFSTEKKVDELDVNRGTPVGFLLGGIVLSQQAKQFSQADPFFGFIGGYRFGRFAQKSKVNGLYQDIFEQDIDEQGYRLVSCKDDDLDPACRRIIKGNKVRYKRMTDRYGDYIKSVPEYKKGILKSGQWNLRFQGIFQSDPRTGSDPAQDAGKVPDFKPFIASLKTFNIETQLWYDLPIASKVTLGPYFAWGGSTVLTKNELSGEVINTDMATAASNGGASTNAGTAGQDVKIDTDIKQYKDYGLHMNVMLFNKRLFLQSVIARGHYEAFKGLVPILDKDDPKKVTGFYNTQNRFVGKLRIIPDGLTYDFGALKSVAPMFGVEVNAGYGPDHIKFFFGTIFRIKGLAP